MNFSWHDVEDSFELNCAEILLDIARDRLIKWSTVVDKTFKERWVKKKYNYLTLNAILSFRLGSNAVGFSGYLCSPLSVLVASHSSKSQNSKLD